MTDKAFIEVEPPTGTNDCADFTITIMGRENTFYYYKQTRGFSLYQPNQITIPILKDAYFLISLDDPDITRLDFSGNVFYFYKGIIVVCIKNAITPTVHATTTFDEYIPIHNVGRYIRIDSTTKELEAMLTGFLLFQ